MFKTKKKNTFFGKVIGAVIASAALSLICGSTAMAAVTAEKENNDTYEKATEFVVGDGATGTLSAESDKDWYKFTLSQASSVTVSFEFSEENSGAYKDKVTLFNDNQTVTYFSDNFPGINGEQETEKYNLAPGTYYLMVSNYSFGYGHPYTVNVTATAVAGTTTEVEKNDTSANANAISLDTQEFGQLSSQNDIDWYKFEVKNPGRISVTFAHDCYEVFGNSWKLNLYADAEGQTLYYTKTYDSNGKEAVTSDDYYVAAGTYYISVEKEWAYTPKRYYFTVNYKDSDTVNGEKENNDTSATANVISTGVKYVGNLSTDKDADWYAFTLVGAEDVSVEFKSNYGFSGTHWNVTLYSFTKTELFTKSVTSSGYASDAQNLPAGTYYVRVCRTEKEGTYTPASYNLTINSNKPDYSYPGKDCVFVNIGGKDYWYENGYRQGTYYDPNGVVGDGTIRGREIYDPRTDGWYWLDACYEGAKATGKEVWMPYIYQDEAKWNLDQMTKIANESDPGMAQCVLNAMLNHSGKWVRYDQNGRMLKGWVTIEGALADLYPDQKGNRYYYDTRTGLMAKGLVTFSDGSTFFFDEITGAMRTGDITINGVLRHFNEGTGKME